MKSKFICLWIGLITACGFGQDWQNNNWVFGDKSWLAFPNAGPVADEVPAGLTYLSGEGCASVSDRLGRLIMFSDGLGLWQHTGTTYNLVTDYDLTTGLMGNISSSQNVIFIPVPDDPEQDSYFIVTISGHTGAPPSRRGLFWSRVDFSTGTVSAPVALQDHFGNAIDNTYFNESEAVTMTLHPTTGYWLVTHIDNGSTGNGFLYSYHVTNAGIGTAILGRPDNLLAYNFVDNPLHPGAVNHANCLKVSPDRQYFAMTTSDSGISIGDFDASDGSFSNITTFDDLPDPRDQDHTYGVEFSPDSAHLYYSLRAGEYVVERNIPLSAVPPTISPGPVPGIRYRGLQLGRDQNIYVSISGDPFLSIIQNPADLATLNANVQSLANNANRGLPQWVWKQHCEPILIDDDDIPPGFPTVLEQRSDWMELTNTVQNNSTAPPGTLPTRAVYHAVNLIELLPEDPANGIDDGFEAEFGSEFVAYIAACDSIAPFDDDFVYRNKPGSGTVKNKPLNADKAGQIKIYPNPTDKTLAITSDSMLRRIVILSIDGKIMLDKTVSQTLDEIDVSHFANGVYLISAETDNGQTHQSKFIKN